MNRSDPTTSLTFDWAERRGFPLILAGCILISFLAHVTTFFVFQVVYPQRVTIPPPPPQISLLTASSPANEALLRWIEAEDPALVASAHSVAAPALLPVPYRPSFATMRTAPLGSPEVSVTVPFPAARSPLAMMRSGRPPAAPPAPSATPFNSTITFSRALQSRASEPPAFRWDHPAAEPLHPLNALIAVTAGGEVRFAFLEQSSGNEQADAAAMEALQRLSFLPGDAAFTWGMVTVSFGRDAHLSPTGNGGSPPAS